MEKRLWKAIALFLLLILVPLYQSGTLLRETEACQHNKKTHEKDCATHSLPVALLIESADFVEEHADAIIALFTIILGIATVRLWVVTRALVDGAEQTAERQLRAYVMIESVQVENFGVGQAPVARVTFRNSGATPAQDVTHWCIMGFDEFPPTVPFPTRDATPLVPVPMAPQGKIITRARERNALDLQKWSELAAGTHAMYVVGEIRYRDAFGKERETDFVLFTGGPFGATDEMGSYREGNRIT